MTADSKQIGRIVFLGTPDFALPPLRMLMEQGYEVAAVITQPDRKAGRGHKLVPPPVKVLAELHGIPVYQFEKISRDGVQTLRELAPDLMITAAYGHILTQEILDIPKHGCINVHASLLPKLRGSAPIQWAIITGEHETGVTTMYTVLALDAGDILERESIQIAPDMTAGELYTQLSELGAAVLKRTLEKLAAGTLERTPQNENEMTYFPMFRKGFGAMDFGKSFEELYNFVRGTNPVPGAYFTYEGEKVKVFAIAKAQGRGRAGEILTADDKNGLVIACADGAVRIVEMQRMGAKQMRAEDSLRGKKMQTGCCVMEEKD